MTHGFINRSFQLQADDSTVVRLKTRLVTEVNQTSLSMFGVLSVHNARSIVNLVEEGGAEVAEVSEGHTHPLRHPM